MLISFLPLVRLVGSVPFHFLIAYSLTHSTWYRRAAKWILADPYVDDRPQWLGALQDAVSSGAVANILISTLMGWQPDLRQSRS